MTLIGIDVSAYQGFVDWDKAKSAGCAFAFIRCHYQSGKDVHFDRNWSESKRVGIARGAYGWVLPGHNQVNQADLFVNYLGDDTGDLAPACDFEKYNGTPTFAELRTFVERVESRTKRLPYIYTSYGFWTSTANYANQTWAKKYPLWHAQYTTAKTPTLKAPFTDWVFWQYSSPGNRMALTYGCGGFDLDMNRFNGDVVDLEKLIGTEVVEPNDPPSSDIEFRLANLEGWAKGIGYKG